MARLRIYMYCLMPDHMHLLVQPRTGREKLEKIIGAIESITTQVYWKRAHEVFAGAPIEQSATIETPAEPSERRVILHALAEWRATLRPEVIRLQHWPRVVPEHYRKKRLWQRSFHDHLIRNADDFENTVQYILQNPVEAGYVSQPYYYPFTGFLTGL